MTLKQCDVNLSDKYFQWRAIKMYFENARNGSEKTADKDSLQFGSDLNTSPKGRKEKTDKLLNYLSNPENPWLDRQTLATEVLGYSKPQSLWNLFQGSELDEIEKEALELRRQRCSTISAKVDQALLKKALEGDVKAIKLYYQRYENWSERQILDHQLDGPPLITITNYSNSDRD
ncbi:hypothetical protein P9J64_00560 [Deltaproteobacteria bacterium IMCC39524]|nr:hypothetical protein [Deltaproteobacteria bacterium IMCC39524]